MSDSTVIRDIPLFPLHTVLFPGGLLPLRVFEARYLDMVRDCLRQDQSFGVCLIESGHEVINEKKPAASTVTADVGCLATILDCDMEQLGLLLLRTRGGRRFQILSARTESSGLTRADIALLGDDLPDCNPDLLLECTTALRRIVTALSSKSDIESPFLEPYQWDDPVWTSNRLCEILPIPLKAKQKLMALEDAGMRIEIVHRFMKQHAIL
ncbi:MAG TPA: LON peptidase substrate-binding domain-containing protein [Burkholderiaceae bacterium]|jgi:Lon protease-like protein|nr:LON peptidase substrate-binding domain-containing protein [Burkholderiaceae bacterium]